jgi:hypothetical protein
MATGYWLDELCCSIPRGVGEFSLLHLIQTGSEAHKISCTMGAVREVQKNFFSPYVFMALNQAEG